MMDRGYFDYLWLDALDARVVFLVTRLKENASVLVEGEISAPRANILADELISLPRSSKSHNADRLLRRVVVWDVLNEREIVLLTNNFKLAAATLAALYKERWQIELFFKALKAELQEQDLRGYQR